MATTTTLHSAPQDVHTHRDRGLRQSLERQRDEILRALRERIRSASETASENMHIDESALTDVVDEMAYALVSLQTETLEKIDDALDLLAAGEYGYCTNCGEPIAARRLEALPFAVRCVDCETRCESRWTAPPTASAAHRPAFLS